MAIQITAYALTPLKSTVYQFNNLKPYIVINLLFDKTSRVLYQFQHRLLLAYLSNAFYCK